LHCRIERHSAYKSLRECYRYDSKSIDTHEIGRRLTGQLADTPLADYSQLANAAGEYFETPRVNRCEGANE